MTKPELILWLKEQRSTLDEIIASACRKFHQDALALRSPEQFGFDLAECQRESWNLKEKMDLCYDRPNTPFVYALWYQGRRVNTFLTHFAGILFDAREQPRLDIFDLGAGTGAVQWAVGLIYHKMRSEGLAFPKLRIINVDTSPFMLQFSRDYLWSHFTQKYRYCYEFSDDILYNINSWSNQQKIPIVNPWITASYLFDISDSSSEGGYKKATLKGFQEIIDAYRPTRFLLLTSLSKESLVDEICKEFDPDDYAIEKIKQALLLQGALSAVNICRGELYEKYKSYLSGYKEASLRRGTSWEDVSFIGTVISKRQLTLLGTGESREGIKLHSTAIAARNMVVLNKDQQIAAQNLNQPTVIIGPAGCGKSIVITERIKNIADELEYNPDLRVLLTSFNKELLGQLKEWLLEILDASRILKIQDDAGGVKILFSGNTGIRENIRILHFDMLPRYFGNVPYWGLVNDPEHNKILTDIIVWVKERNNIKDDRFDRVLCPEFLLEEYYRVIYGLQVGIRSAKEEYLSVDRKGRGVALDQTRRDLVWQCLHFYADHIYNKKVPSFVIRRQLLLNHLRDGGAAPKFDYVVVDEFQDCTSADFEIFFHLLNDPNYLIMAGDLAQAVHLGRSANIESLRYAIRGDRVMKDIRWRYLDGSYRLPFRICEAIRKISEHIHLSFRKNIGASVLRPYKGAPPGARPIVVVAGNEEEMSVKIQGIIQSYEVFGLEDTCVLEKDPYLRSRLHIESDTVLRLKGLERKCVIWSTRAGIEHKREKFEFVYTILTRTSCLLIIALFDGLTDGGGTQEIYKEAIGLLDPERLISWDRETKETFSHFCRTMESADQTEE